MYQRPIKENVYVGMKRFIGEHENPYLYCWESEKIDSITCSSRNFERYIKGLRRFIIAPSQLINTGTNNPFFTDPLDNKHFKELYHYLSRPHVIITSNEEKDSSKLLDYSLACTLLIDLNETKLEWRLGNLPRLFRTLECNPDDLHFHEEKRPIPKKVKGTIKQIAMDYRISI
ncbi:hypothetical protein HYV49_04470 [Candidatus Pacearchaeota archaeon]|nr:hypothetical protein [Candidatus Pacearchaeota archaeon]